jgi:hypothetical protein
MENKGMNEPIVQSQIISVWSATCWLQGGTSPITNLIFIISATWKAHVTVETLAVALLMIVAAVVVVVVVVEVVIVVVVFNA